MKVRAIDEGHDWKFGFNQSDYKEFSEAVKQNVFNCDSNGARRLVFGA